MLINGTELLIECCVVLHRLQFAQVLYFEAIKVSVARLEHDVRRSVAETVILAVLYEFKALVLVVLSVLLLDEKFLLF